MNIIKIISITMITKQYDDQIFSGYAQYSLLVIHAVNASWQLLNTYQKCLKPFTLPTRDVIGAPKKAKPVVLADRQICLVENNCVSVVIMLPLVASYLPFWCYPSTFQLFETSNMFFSQVIAGERVLSYLAVNHIPINRFLKQLDREPQELRA